MEMTHFIRTLRRYWFVAVGLVLLSVAGVFSYHHLYTEEEAEATVAVLDPLVARPVSYGQAQLAFDAVVRSRQLAERVGRRLERSPEWVQGRLSVAVISSLSPGTVASPLFAVRGKDEKLADAERLTDVATEEARLLFIELNDPDPAVIQESFAQQRAQLQEQARVSREAFYRFASENSAQDLGDQIGKQRDLIVSLRLAVVQSRADESAAAAYGRTVALEAARRRAVDLEESLGEAEERLATLLGLQARYIELSSAHQSDQARVAQLEQHEQGLIAGQHLPLEAQVKILDRAHRRSQLVWLVLTYMLGALLGTFAAASSVYAIALAQREPTTAADLASAFHAPVLVRLTGARG